MNRKQQDGIVWYEFEQIAATGLVKHCFSRIGGVSKSPYNEMNLAYHMGDTKSDVDENFRLICHIVGFDDKQVKMTKQIHQGGIQILELGDDVFEGMDGLITAVSGSVLTSYYADCVPLLYLDPVKKVIANSHAGWRGTALEIGGTTISKMMVKFNCNPVDILVGIGPTICENCFEVGIEVAKILKWNHPFAKKKTVNKWLYDLVQLNRYSLIRMGVLDKNIEVANLCTFEDSKHFFSHRRDGVARGNMSAMISLNSSSMRQSSL